MHFQTELRRITHSFRRSTKITSGPNQKLVIFKIWEVIILHIKKSDCYLLIVHLMSLILVHFLKWNDMRTQPWSKTNWPFSMENMSCRWGGSIPAYLPPLFLRTKQAMSATRVRSATAHMVPITQPWVEKLLCWLAIPEDKKTPKRQRAQR